MLSLPKRPISSIRSAKMWAPIILSMALILGACAQSGDDNEATHPRRAISGLNANAWEELDTVWASDGAAASSFGSAVALSEDLLVVGAYRASADASRTGVAYVYERDPAADTWTQIKKLMPSDPAASAGFGWSVAVHDGVAVVGAYLNVGTSSGAAYIFERDAGGPDNWGEVKTLLPSDAPPVGMFGRSVDIDTDTIVVGAVRADGSGAAYVFERDQGGSNHWGESKKLVGSGSAQNDDFGSSVSISGDTVAVGAVSSDAQGLDSGAAYIFARDQGGPDNWGEVKRIVGSDSAIGDHLGGSVSLDADVLVAGATRDYTNGTRTGSAHIFARNQGGADNWGEVKKLVASDFSTNARFGISVSVYGDVVVIGADRNSSSATEAGAAYIFERAQGGAGNWGEVKKLTAENAAEDDNLGWSLATGPDLVAVGAMGSSAGTENAGAAVLFGSARPTPAEDAGPDTSADVGPDATTDAGSDTSADVTHDTTQDTSPDVYNDIRDDIGTDIDADIEDGGSRDTTADAGDDAQNPSDAHTSADTDTIAEADVGNDASPVEPDESAAREDGCGCSSTSAPSNGLGLLLGILGLFGLRFTRKLRK